MSDCQNKAHTVLEICSYSSPLVLEGVRLFSETLAQEFSVTKPSQDINACVFDDVIYKD